LKSGLIKKVTLGNYRSIRHCEVELSPLSVIVGRNAAGKSNFVDALHFVRDAVTNQLEFALRTRGGFTDIYWKGGVDTPPWFSIRLDLELPAGPAFYNLVVEFDGDRTHRVSSERCVVQSAGTGRLELRRRYGHVFVGTDPTPTHNLARPGGDISDEISASRLCLPSLVGWAGFEDVYHAISKMVFHNFNPEIMRTPQRPEPGALLAYDGRNVAGVLRELQASDKLAAERVVTYLSAIGVPLDSIKPISAGGYDVLEFLVSTATNASNRSFTALMMSEGTMRALGILVSLMSAAGVGDQRPSLIAIEEPETALHPAATGALFDAMNEAAASTQVIVTCHSPDVLDQPALDPDSIIVATNEGGSTQLGRVSAAKRDLLKRHLFTAGELLRMDQLTPEVRPVASEEELESDRMSA